MNKQGQKSQARAEKGFTLMELLIAMAIIAVLIALGIAGYSIARRAARNTQRKDVIREVQMYMEDFETKHRTSPDTIVIDVSASQVTLSYGTDEETYDVSSLSAFDTEEEVGDCSGCSKKLEKDHFQYIYNSGASRLGICLEPDGDFLIDGECGAGID